MWLHPGLSSAGAPVGMPGGEPQMFVRCSDPDIICETKNMVLVMLRCPSVLCVLLLWLFCQQMPCTPFISLWQ